jgi:uncharacterized protein
MSANLAPVQKAERIDVLDILRGYALFAILIGNIQTVRVPWFTPGFDLPDLATIDQLAHTLIYTTLGTELYLVFSFLFGLGFAVQISRAQTKGVQGVALFVRRMAVLFVIGCLHYLLIWDGDILRVYAVFGIVLLLLNVLPNRALWIGAILLLLVSPVVTVVMNNIDLGGPAGSDVLTQIRAVYGSGSYLDVVGYRVQNFIPDFFAELSYDGLNVLAMFMLGMYAGRRRIFEDLAAYQNVFLIGMVGGLIAAVVGNLLEIDIIHRPGMAALHISFVTLLAQYPWWAKRLSVLIPFGRLSLTNYIVQNIIATTLFYGYGFGYMEKMGTATVLLISLIIGVVQIIFSYLWQQRFNFGPLEWVWRSLTYGRPMPMRRTDTKPVEAAPAT